MKLYSSSPSEVVSILLEFLLKALESADVVQLPDTRLDDWKPLVMKLSNKEPEMLLSLLKVVLQMLETRQALKDDSGNYIYFPHMILGFNQLESWCTRRELS